MSRFGTQLRVYRRQCRDPLRGDMLTQERLGELLGEALGHTGYSGAAVSDWERNKSKIDEDDRPVLLALITILVRCQGMRTPHEANVLLHSGNYRALDPEEQAHVFPAAAISPSFLAAPMPNKRGPLETVDAERQKLMILQQKVQRFWVDGVLRTMLSGAPPLQLSWEAAPRMVQQPWESVVTAMHLEEHGARSIEDEFFAADRALLILGETGSGKTTTLLQLADSLGRRAAAHPAEPVPVVLNLSSWAADRLSLDDWIVEELVAKYQIPRRIGRPWLEADALNLLLDGFDELPALHRSACARAINKFRQEWGLTGIVVSTRPSEYEQAGIRLRLGGAIELLPLSSAQCEHYLDTRGVGLRALRQAVHGDRTLRELARMPLFLDVMRRIYRDAPPAELSPLSAVTEETTFDTSHRQRGNDTAPPQHAQERLFQVYEQRVFRIHRPRAAYAPQDTERWLAWLAQKMQEHDQALFLLEELQPSWLLSRNRRLYVLVGHALAGLGGGALAWLLLQWLRAIIPQFPSTLSRLLADWMSMEAGFAELVVLLSGSVALALVMAIIHLWSFERRAGSHRPGGDWALRRRGTLVGVVTGAVTIATMLLVAQWALALAWGLGMGFMFAAMSRYLTGLDYRHDIRPVEALGWSWFEAGKGVVVMLALALSGELLEAVLFGYNGMLPSLLTFGVAGFVIGGLRGGRIEKKSAVNQGILLSLRSAFISAILAGLVIGAVTWLLRTPVAAAYTVLLVALIVFPFFGGATVVKHYLLRLLLWREGQMPLRYARFLDYAAQVGFLRRVGGGYTFIHRLLQSYFAAKR